LYIDPNKHTGTWLADGVTPFPTISKTQIWKRINKVLAAFAIGTPQNIVTTVLLLAMDCTPNTQTYVDDLLSSGIFSCLIPHQQKMLKQCSILLRRYEVCRNGLNVAPQVVLNCAYLELSYGRSVFISDYETEIKNRTTYTYHLKHPQNTWAQANHTACWRNKEVAYLTEDAAFYAALQDEIQEIVEKVMPKKPTQMIYADFLKNANNWLASGSAPNQHATINVPCPDGSTKPQEVKVGKRGWAEKLNPDKFARHIYSAYPIEMATASEKYENGKGRALYGVEPKHYMHNTYATKGFEERLHLCPGLEKGVDGQSALKLEANRCAITKDAGMHCMMLDYADFNVQHTPSAQSMIFDTIANVATTRGACNDFITANKWIAASKHAMHCQFQPRVLPHKTYSSQRQIVTLPHAHTAAKPKIMRVVQGMYSGTRSTDLINTMLNLAYYKVAHKHVVNQLGILPDNLYHAHQGDDVWISTSNPLYCALLYYTLNNMGLVMQKNKQMFGPMRGEYLRVLYSAGHARGYLGRSLANFMLKEIQRPLPIDGIANLTMVRDSLSVLLRRGLSPLAYSILWHDQRNRWHKIIEFQGDPKPITIPSKVLELPVEQGGIGYVWAGYTQLKRCIILGTNPLRNDPTVMQIPNHNTPLPHIIMPPNAINENTPRNCTKAWISQLSLALHPQGNINTESLTRASLLNNYADAIMIEWRRSIARKYKATVRDWIDNNVANNPKLQQYWNYMYCKCQMQHAACDNCVKAPQPAGMDTMLQAVVTTKPIGHVQSASNIITTLVDRTTPPVWLPDEHITLVSYAAHCPEPDSTMTLHADTILARPASESTQTANNKHARTTAHSMYVQATVRSPAKSLPILRSALGLTAAEAFIMVLTTTKDIPQSQFQAIDRWRNLILQGNEHIIQLLASTNISTLGLMESFIQPSILQCAYADILTLYTNYTATASAAKCISKTTASLTVGTLCRLSTLMHNLANNHIRISY